MASKIDFLLVYCLLATPAYAKKPLCHHVWNNSSPDLIAPANGLPYVPLVRPTQSPRTDSRDVKRRLEEDILLPVLTEGRAAGVKSEIEALDRNGLRIRTADGRYDVIIDRNTVFDELGQVVPPIRYEGNRVTGRVYIHPDWLSEENMKNPVHVYMLRGLIRSMVRADEVHSHMGARNEDERFTYLPSEMQAFTIQQLVQSFRNGKVALEAAQQHKPNVSGLMAPPGYGKTVISLLLANHLFGGNYNKPEEARIPETSAIIVAVENVDILDSWYEKAKNYFHLDASEIAVVYESNLKGVKRSRISEKCKLVLTTRTGAHKNLDILTDFMHSKPKHLAILDEGHNAGLVVNAEEAGKATGQYQDILARWRRSLDENSNVLFLSATMWHQSSQMIVDKNLINGNLVAPFLTVHEVELVRQGLYVERLAVTAMMRAMYSGYSSPWLKTTSASVIDRQTGEEKLFIKEMRGSELIETLDREVLRSIARDIVQARRTGEPVDRGLIFVRGTDRANLVAKELQTEVRRIEKELGMDQNTLVNPYHTGVGSLADGVGFLKDTEAQEGRYLVVDRKFSEGVDAPPVNRIIMLRPVDLRDEHQVRSVVQAVTRAIRVSLGKINFKVIDYSGKIDQLLQLPDRIRTQTVPRDGNEGSEGGTGRPRFRVEDISRSEAHTHTETVVATQSSPSEALQTILQAVNGKPLDQVTRETSPFIDKQMANALLELVGELRTLRSGAQDKIAKEKWGSRLLDVKARLESGMAQIQTEVPDLISLARSAAGPMRDGDISEIAQTLQGRLDGLQETWNDILEDLASADPYTDAKVVIQIDAGNTPASKYRRQEIGNWLAKMLGKLGENHGSFEDLEVIRANDSNIASQFQIELNGPQAFSYLAGESSGTIYLNRPDMRTRGGASRGDEYAKIFVRVAGPGNLLRSIEHRWTETPLNQPPMRLDEVSNTAFVGGPSGTYSVRGLPSEFLDNQGYRALGSRLELNREWYLYQFIRSELLPKIRSAKRAQ